MNALAFLAVAVAVVALLWLVVGRSLYQITKMLPLVKDLNDTLDRGDHIRLLNEAVMQFRDDPSGSSLRDAVNQIETLQLDSRKVVNSVSIMVEVIRNLVGALGTKIDLGAESNQRMEDAAKLVATQLAAAQRRVDGVAFDLAEAHQRADQVTETTPGMKADAAALLTPLEKDLLMEPNALNELPSTPPDA